MKFKYDGYNWLVRLDKGEKLIDSLTQIVKDQKIGGAWISGLGACQSAEVGFYDLASKQYIWQQLNEELEIVNLQGNVSWQNNQPVLHVHGTFTNRQMQALGGHVKELKVAGTCEVLIHRWYESGLNRQLDEPTGLNLLDI